jgi:hypothetical protein
VLAGREPLDPALTKVAEDIGSAVVNTLAGRLRCERDIEPQPCGQRAICPWVSETVPVSGWGKLMRLTALPHRTVVDLSAQIVSPVSALVRRGFKAISTTISAS